MENNQIGWALFFNAATQFSDSFQKQLSTQLFLRFYELLGVKEDKVRPRFALFVGLHEMQLVTKEDYTFGLVSVNSFAML